MEQIKRKRGCNYTAEEINIFLDLVKEYQCAIEEKKNGSIFLARKKEAWEIICKSYNAVATSGFRNVEQLKTLYDNRKQKARKSLAESNKKEFLRHIAPLCIQEEDIQTALEHEKSDKGQWCKTSLTAHDQKILDILKEQGTPLVNSCDSAAIYFRDIPQETIDVTPLVKLEPEEIQETLNKGQPDFIGYSVSECNDSALPGPSQVETETKKKIKENINNVPSRKQKKRKLKKGLVSHKQLYLKQKRQYANLQKRKVLQDMRLRKQEYAMRQREHEMLKKEHELRMAILQHECNVKNINVEYLLTKISNGMTT